MHNLLDSQFIISTVGLIGIIAIVFAESGLLIGFFLPGDSLLFTAGLLASQGHLDLMALLVFCFIAAVLGDNVGYYTGYKLGHKVFKHEDSFFFKKSYIEKTQAFYQKYGRKTIIMARFVPIVRTFAPIVAGTAHMDYKTFFRFNLIGGFLWTWLVLLLGYFLGSVFPDIQHYLTPIILIIIVLSIIPTIFEIWRAKKAPKV
jgi:membrane-associated protein